MIAAALYFNAVFEHLADVVRLTEWASNYGAT